MIAPGTIRAGPIVAVPNLLRGFGIDPTPIIVAAGLVPDLLDDTETAVPFLAVPRLLALCAERTGCAHFGLLVGQRAGISALGVLGMVMQNSADVRTALQTVLSHFGDHDAAGILVLRDERTVATLSYLEPAIAVAIAGIEHFMDGVLAIAVQTMRSLCGPEWRPFEALLPHARPADPDPIQALVRAPVRFGAEEVGLTFDPAYLDQPLAHAQPDLRELLLKFMTAWKSDQGGIFCDDVRQVLRARVTHGEASLAEVANALGLHPRTLHRRLAEAGTTFKELVNEIRHETARQLLEQTSMPLGRIATLLGYADASSFTRSFRTRAGIPPAVWRARRGPK